MAEPFLSEIRMYGFNWPPRGWAMCDGQSLPINNNQALFSLLGTTFGGDGRTSFNLPDLRGRAPVSFGQNGNIPVPIGESRGTEIVTLTEAEMGEHSHTVKGTTDSGKTKNFTNAIFAAGFDINTSQSTNIYGTPTNLTNLNPKSVSTNGGGSWHSNVQPSLVVNFCISLTGQFPARN